MLSTTNKIWIKKVLAAVLASLVLLSAAPAANPTDSGKHISVYSPVAVYSLPVLDHAGREYVGLLELLEPLGRVSSQSEGQRWKLRFNAIDAEFAGGRREAVSAAMTLIWLRHSSSKMRMDWFH